MPSSYTLRMQFGPHQDPEVVTRQLLELVRRAPVDEIMFFYFAEDLNDGHETIDRIKQWIDRSRPYRRALTEAGIAVSLNPWHSILHGDKGRKLKPGQDWQTLVNPAGIQCEACVCSLDPGWRRYYAETLRLYAQEDFRVIWIDDDIRFHNHGPFEWGGCFCPLHVAEFNRRAGLQATREEIVANCTAPGEPHPWRAVWLDMWEETMLELVAGWRRIVEENGCRLGLMTSSPQQHAAEGRRWADWWQAIAGDQAPIHRPGFCAYAEVLASNLPRFIMLLDQNRSIEPADVECGPEIECFAYGRWNKSFRATAAEISLGQILGATNLNISLYDFMGNDPSDEPQRADFLRAWRPVCDWLADEFPANLRSVGVGIPWSEDMGRQMHTDGSGKWESLVCPLFGWPQWLGAAGHAFAMRASSRLNAVAGPVAWTFEEEELLRWLGQGVLLDGMAANILVQRGLGALIGFQGGRMITKADILYSVEQTLDERFGLRAGSQMTLNRQTFHATLFQGQLVDGAIMASDLRSPTQQVVGHGLVLFENELGGRVATVPWDPNAGLRMSVYRACQLTKVLAYLDPENHHGWVEGGAWLVPQFLSDGHRWRGVIWNVSGDALQEILVHRPVEMPAPQSGTQVTAQSKRIPAEIEGNRIKLSEPLHQWEFVVLL